MSKIHINNQNIVIFTYCGQEKDFVGVLSIFFGNDTQLFLTLLSNIFSDCEKFLTAEIYKY